MEQPEKKRHSPWESSQERRPSRRPPSKFESQNQNRDRDKNLDWSGGNLRYSQRRQRERHAMPDGKRSDRLDQHQRTRCQKEQAQNEHEMIEALEDMIEPET